MTLKFRAQRTIADQKKLSPGEHAAQSRCCSKKHVMVFIGCIHPGDNPDPNRASGANQGGRSLCKRRGGQGVANTNQFGFPEAGLAQPGCPRSGSANESVTTSK